MPIEILMPALSPTMKEGNLAKWHKKDGDPVKTGDVIADIETDKAIMEMEAVDDGVIYKTLISEGTKAIPVGSPIAVLLKRGEKESDAEGFKPKKASPLEEKNNKIEKKSLDALKSSNDYEETSNVNHRIKASPLARRIAFEKKIDLSKISGSGPYGRIIRDDVLEYKNAILTNDSRSISQRHEPRFLEVSNMRSVIAKRLSESKQTIPHFYLTVECVIDKLLALRSEINGANPEIKITVNDFIIKAVAMSMKKFEMVNASWIDNKILQYQNIDVSVAVGMDDGLITPIVRDADQKPLSTISNEMKDLINRAKSGKLKLEEFQGGSLTISNLGMFGIREFSAIINPPQSCILAVGKSEKRPIVANEKIEIATMMTCTLSADHRIVDGLLGAKFMDSLRMYLENPSLMLI